MERPEAPECSMEFKIIFELEVRLAGNHLLASATSFPEALAWFIATREKRDDE